MAVLRRGRFAAVGGRFGSGLGWASAGSVVDGVAVAVVVGVVVRVAVADSEAQPPCLCRESVHFRVFLNVDDVAEVGPEKKIIKSFKFLL